MPGDGGGGTNSWPIGPASTVRAFGSNDIWLEIQFDTNAANQVDILLHGATNAVTQGTNSVWQLLTTTNLANTNAWTVLEIKVDDGTTNTLHFGPFPDDNPPVSFFRAELATNLFLVVATNLHYPTVIDYHPPQRSLIISYNPPYDQTNAFGIIDEHAFLTNWSELGWIPNGFYNFRLVFATAKTTANGFTNGDLFFGVNLTGESQRTQAQIGWLSSNGMTYNTNWLLLPNDYNQPTDLHIDRTGIWSNDLVAVTSDDITHSLQLYNVWRIHSQTDTNLITRIQALHLEGLLTLPDDESRYGPWAGRLLTADRDLGQIFAVDTNGTYTSSSLPYLTNSLGIAVPVAAECIRLIETNQSLYCVAYTDYTSLLLKIPGAFFRQWQGDILMMQSGILGGGPKLSIVHWNSTNANFEVRTFALYDYFNQDVVYRFTGCVFAPIELPPVQ